MKSQAGGGGEGVGEGMRDGEGEVEGKRTSQNSPVQPTKHSQVMFEPVMSAMQVPLLQSIKSHGDGVGLGVGLIVNISNDEESSSESQNTPVHPGKHSHITVSLPSSVQLPLVQLIKSHKEISTVGDGVAEGDNVGMLGGMEVEKGASKLSELETKKNMDEDGDMDDRDGPRRDDVSRGMSQKSPVHPAKHSQVKLSPKSRVMHVPLLQSTRSQMGIGGLGEGVMVRAMEEEDGTRGTSQNIPVYPGSHSHMGSSLSRSTTHTPLLQLKSSQGETSGVGVGEMEMDVGINVGKD